MNAATAIHSASSVAFALGSLLASCGGIAAQNSPERQAAYTIHTFPFDESRPLEVGALACCGEQDALLVGTRLGDVFRIEQVYGDPADARYRTFARGLAQPLGFVSLDGWLYCAQRGELTRMRDVDGDGRADEFETVCDDWEISGNYHEYAFGPRVDHEGKLWVTLNKPFGEEPYGPADWRGWAVRIDPQTGVMEPMATGLRSPAGVEVSPEGVVFFTDNQGEWCNASKLAVLEHGDFHGHPFGLASRERAGEPFASIATPRSGVLMHELARTIPAFRMPAVWFPYEKAGKSPCGMVWDRSEGAFGPFAGQLFVGDQHDASILRVFLERIDGHWQGACFAFVEGFDCGITRLCQGRNGSLFAGASNAGWGGKGTRPWALHRLDWNGTVPFAIVAMRLLPDGFDLEFSEPLAADRASDPASYSLHSYTYRLESRYGGPEVDPRTIEIRSATLDATRTRVRLVVDPLRAGFVHELDAAGVRAARDGAALSDSRAFYTAVKLAR